jgi:hypothetical protein
VTVGLEIVRSEDVERSTDYVAPSCTAEGPLRSWRASPEGYPLWLVVAELHEGAEVTWTQPHGDEAVYVVRGELDVDGHGSCGRAGAVVVEEGAACRFRATRPTRVVHVGPYDPSQPTDGIYGAPEPEGHGVHVVGEGGVHRAVEGPRESCFLADSTCPTCRITLLFTSRLGAYKAASHTHSQDELIHLLWGELQVGRERILPGTTLAIRAGHRYGFRSTDDGYAFLNYRRDVSTYVTDPKAGPQLETGPMMGMQPTGAR